MLPLPPLAKHILSPKVLLAVMKRAEEFIAENLEFKPDYFKLLTEDAATAAATTLSSSSNKKKQAKTTPTNEDACSILKDVSVEDVKENAQHLRRALKTLLYELAQASGGIENLLLKHDVASEKEKKEENKMIVPVLEVNENML